MEIDHAKSILEKMKKRHNGNCEDVNKEREKLKLQIEIESKR
jgi:hypothetical protein